MVFRHIATVSKLVTKTTALVSIKNVFNTILYFVMLPIWRKCTVSTRYRLYVKSGLSQAMLLKERLRLKDIQPHLGTRNDNATLHMAPWRIKILFED